MITTGLCQCGCAEKTWIAEYSNMKRGWIKGVPINYIRGHHMKGRKRTFSDQWKIKQSIAQSKRFSKQEDNPNWKGGLMFSDGYYWIRVRNHPYAKQGYLKRARFITEKVLGRYLRSNEETHHINENKMDDRNCNLLVGYSWYHKYLHGKMRGGLNERILATD